MGSIQPIIFPSNFIGTVTYFGRDGKRKTYHRRSEYGKAFKVCRVVRFKGTLAFEKHGNHYTVEVSSDEEETAISVHEQWRGYTKVYLPLFMGKGSPTSEDPPTPLVEVLDDGGAWYQFGPGDNRRITSPF